MYVRTRKGICKILETNGDICLVDKNGTIHSDSNFNEYIRVEDIIKSTKNIIDLIEVGDYVNGVEVIGKEFDNFNKEYLQCGVGDYVICTFEVKDIKTILTKKQYENNCYKVEDK